MDTINSGEFDGSRFVNWIDAGGYWFYLYADANYSNWLDRTFVDGTAGPTPTFTQTPTPTNTRTPTPTPTATSTPPPAATNTPTPTFTPTPGQCAAPGRPVDPPVTSCSGGTYSATWEWNAVWDPDGGGWATQYQLQVDNESSFASPLFSDSGWVGAAVFGCAGGGVCRYTSSGLTAGTGYFSRVRARGTCTESPWSSTVSVYEACMAGSISANPNPCTINVGETQCSSTISWNTANAQNVRILVDNNWIFASGASGSSPANFIDNGGYWFNLRGTPLGGGSEIEIDSVFVIGQDASCSLTAPSNPSANVTSTSASLSWSPGSGGSYQILRLDTSQSAVANGCPSGCLVEENLPSGQSNYSTGNILTPGQRYYWDVTEYLALSCQEGFVGGTDDFFTNVLIDLVPGSVSITPGDNATLTAIITSASPIDRVEFVSADTAIATISPSSDNSSLYQTVVTGVSAGVTQVTATVYLTGFPSGAGSDSSTITIGHEPWWQTQDVDVITTGNIQSAIPSGCSLPVCNPVFSISGSGGYPGVPVYGGTSVSFESGSTSSTNWMANSVYSQRRAYDYSYFRSLIPQGITLNPVASVSVDGSFFESGGTTDSSGYTWYLYNGASLGSTLRINTNMSLSGGRRVILFVENADIELGGRINLADRGDDFVMLVVDGDTRILPVVANPAGAALEGVYMTDGTFATGQGDQQLRIRGFVAAHTGMNLERDLGSANQTAPAEIFENAPELVFTYPKTLTLKRILWREVAP